MSTYVIVRPGERGHVCDTPSAHLVVDVEEWVKVYHGEKAAYDAPVLCHGFDSAHNKRNRMNNIDDQVTETPEVLCGQPETAMETTQGIKWLGEKATA